MPYDYLLLVTAMGIQLYLNSRISSILKNFILQKVPLYAAFTISTRNNLIKYACENSVQAKKSLFLSYTKTSPLSLLFEISTFVLLLKAI